MSLELRHLTLDDVDHLNQSVQLGRRPQATVLDPATWSALQRCLTHREELRTADLAVRIVERVHPDQLADATPCTEWNVRTLMNHVVSGNLFFAHLATGSRPPYRDVDHLGHDPLIAFRDSVHAVSAAFEADGFLDRVITAPFGQEPGSQRVDMRRNELTVHGWDLARATGQSTDFDPEIVAACLASYTASPWLKDRGSAPFDVEEPAPPGATDADRLAAFLGRKV